MSSGRSQSSNLGDWILRVWRWLTGTDGRRPIYREFKQFFGEQLTELQTHDKLFPGYDVASLHRALGSFREECCLESRELGSCPLRPLRRLFDSFQTAHGRLLKSDALVFQRVAIDVDRESSVLANGLYLAVMHTEAGAGRLRRTASLQGGAETSGKGKGPEKIAILLTINGAYHHWDGMDTDHVPGHQVMLSIACSSREVADRFFVELEERRKRLSVFRGKVIDPVIHGGAVQGISFRAVKKVKEKDLVLPEEVTSLVRQTVVGFYENADLLEGLEVEMKRGILLHGPPGTGKTSLSLYLAGLLPRFTICFVSGDRLLHPREVCRMARYLQPSMVVFEDIDLIALQRDANGLATVLGELMNQIDGCEPTEQVLFVMNTNSLDRLETAVKNRPGRVDQIIEIPLPDRQARRQLFHAFARKVQLPEGDLEAVLEVTRNMSPSMLKEIVKRAVVAAVTRDGQGEEQTVRLEEEDLLLAAEQVRALRDPVLIPGNLGFRRPGE
jgi:energy-coupling factor transporter ATP-binding protein EcfA2